jgi:hypothetical protein
MKQDGRKQDVSEDPRKAEMPHAPAPGKVTRASRLAEGPGQAVQRKPLAPSVSAARPRSALDSLDAEMDAAHRGLSALSQTEQPAGQPAAQLTAQPEPQAVQRQQLPQVGTQTAPQPQGGTETAPQPQAPAVDVAALSAGLRFTAPVVSTSGNALGIADALTWIEDVQRRLHEAIQAHGALPADHPDRGRLGTAIAAGAEQAAGHMTTMANTIRAQVETLVRLSSPLASTPAEGDAPAQPPQQATLPGSSEVDRMRTAAAGLSRAAHGSTSVLIENVRQLLAGGAGNVADAALAIYQGLGVLSARGDWVTGYRQDSIATADATTQAAADKALRSKEGARDGLNAVFAESGYNRYGVQSKVVGKSWEPEDWCGMFVATHMFRSAGLDGELRAGFYEVGNVNDFFNYTQKINGSRVPLTLWVPEEGRWMDLREYHQLRGSERMWTPRDAIQSEIQEGGAPFRSGDVCLINHSGGTKAQHIVMVDSYDATTGELRTIEGNTLGIRSDANGMASRNGEGEFKTDSGNTTVGLHIRQMDGTAPKREGRGAYANKAGNTVLGSGRLSVVDFEDHRYSSMPIAKFPKASLQMSPEDMDAAKKRPSHVHKGQARGPSAR